MILHLIFALQLHCGVQQFGSQYLSYGLLVYTENDKPQITYFEKPETEFKEHPHCAKIREKMTDEEVFIVELSEDGKTLVEIK